MTHKILISTRDDLYITSKDISADKNLSFNELKEEINFIYGDNVHFIGGEYSRVLKKTCYHFISECLHYIAYMTD